MSVLCKELFGLVIVVHKFVNNVSLRYYQKWLKMFTCSDVA